MDTKCHCGKPLHYTDEELKNRVIELVKQLGEFIPTTVVGKGTYLVQRHYIALHGIKGADLDLLGFKRLNEQPNTRTK